MIYILFVILINHFNAVINIISILSFGSKNSTVLVTGLQSDYNNSIFPVLDKAMSMENIGSKNCHMRSQGE